MAQSLPYVSRSCCITGFSTDDGVDRFLCGAREERSRTGGGMAKDEAERWFRTQSRLAQALKRLSISIAIERFLRSRRHIACKGRSDTTTLKRRFAPFQRRGSTIPDVFICGRRCSKAGESTLSTSSSQVSRSMAFRLPRRTTSDFADRQGRFVQAAHPPKVSSLY